MATQMNGQTMGGMVPIQLGNGQQQAPYGVQMPTGMGFPPQQMQPVQPTGQQTINGNAGYSYGVESLPPAPQQGQQQNAPYMGQNGNFGLTPQWQQGMQGPQPGFPQQQPVQQPQQGGWQQPVQQWGQAPQQGAGQQAPQQGWPPQQQGAGQLDLNTRLDGAHVPQQLRGRTLGEALQIYNALSTNWAQRTNGQQTPAQQSLNQMQPQGGQAPQQQGSAVPQNGAARPNPWTQPEQFFGSLLEQKLEERLGPVIQQSQQQAVTQAFGIAKSGIADFQALEGDVMQMLANADPQSLANPATWIGAADIVRGRQVREGRYQQPQPQVPGQQNGFGGQNPAMMRMQPAGQMGQVPAYGFFTESPTAPSVSQFGGTAGGAQPTQGDYQTAQKFGMPIQEYMAWKVGISAQPQQGQMAYGGAR